MQKTGKATKENWFLFTKLVREIRMFLESMMKQDKYWHMWYQIKAYTDSDAVG